MKHTLTQRLQRVVPAAMVVALGGLLAAGPVAAQQQQAGGRFRVLVANLQPQNGADKGFGEDVAKELKKLIEDMDTHQPVDKGDLKKALKKYDLKDDDLDCIKARQLAIQMQVELVACGSYTPDKQITEKVVSSKEGGEFEIPSFQQGDAKQAAQQIFTKFKDYVGQLRMVAFCYDYLQSSQFGSALETCDKASAINPKSVSALYGRARALMGMDSLTQALASLEKVLDLNPANQDALLTAGVVAAKVNRQEQARKYFRDYLQLNPDNVDVRLKVATDLSNAGDPEGALRLAQEGTTGDSTNLNLLEYVGHFALAAAENARQQGANGEAPDTAHSMELYNTAMDAYQKVFEAKGDSADTQMLRNMVAVMTKLNRTQEAVDLGKKIVATKPDDADLLYTYAMAQQQAGNLDAALTTMDKALSIDPTVGSGNAYALEAQWVVQSGQLGRAKTLFQKALGNVDGAQKDALSDQLASVAFITGYKDKYQKGAKDAALAYFALARDYATTERTKGMANFFTAYDLFEQAKAVQEPQTAAAAKKALPMFQEALKYFSTPEANAYAKTQASVPLAKLIDATNQYIDIQQLLIKRGK